MFKNILKQIKAELQLVLGLCVFISSSPASQVPQPISRGCGGEEMIQLLLPAVMAHGRTCGIVPMSQRGHQVSGVCMVG